MASDLIYREDAKVFVRHACYKKINPIDYLDEVPAADVVEVVRCKDCVSARPATGDTVLLCDAWSDEYSTEVRADGYCYLGEKKRKAAEIDQVKEDEE